MTAKVEVQSSLIQFQSSNASKHLPGKNHSHRQLVLSQMEPPPPQEWRGGCGLGFKAGHIT